MILTKTFSSAFLTASSAILSAFKSNEIKSDTRIMGVPVWSIVVGFGAYICWNVAKSTELERKCVEFEREIAEEKRHSHQMYELMMRFLESEKGEKDAMRRDIAELKQMRQS